MTLMQKMGMATAIPPVSQFTYFSPQDLILAWTALCLEQSGVSPRILGKQFIQKFKLCFRIFESITHSKTPLQLCQLGHSKSQQISSKILKTDHHCLEILAIIHLRIQTRLLLFVYCLNGQSMFPFEMKNPELCRDDRNESQALTHSRNLIFSMDTGQWLGRGPPDWVKQKVGVGGGVCLGPSQLSDKLKPTTLFFALEMSVLPRNVAGCCSKHLEPYSCFFEHPGSCFGDLGELGLTELPGWVSGWLNRGGRGGVSRNLIHLPNSLCKYSRQFFCPPWNHSHFLWESVSPL